MAQVWAKKFYRSKEWQRVREFCLMRDVYLCQYCGSPAKEVHHIDKLTANNIHNINISLRPDNLVSLCRDCHFDVHKMDKIEGKKKKNEKLDCEDDYFFDENGVLVKKISPLKII